MDCRRIGGLEAYFVLILHQEPAATFLPSDIYHTGFVVADIEEAIANPDVLGIRRWTAPTRADNTRRGADGSVM